MKSKYLISYTIDSITNIIAYEDEEERDGAFRQYQLYGILINQGTRVHPQSIEAYDQVANASYNPLH